MIAFRITGKKHANDISGTGAGMFGGRWNKKGTPVLYTSESKELALLETIVHTPPMLVPDLDILTLEFSDTAITIIEAHDLPANWKDYPAPSILAEITEQWIEEGKNIALKVPSCIIHSSYNYILNTSHSDYLELVKVIDHHDFHFDSRLIK